MFCLDTNIIIFALNRRKPNIWIKLSDELRAKTALMIPSMVRYELEFGIAKSDRPIQSRKVLETLFARGFEHLDFDTEDAIEAAEIRANLNVRGIGIGPYDILIAAQARRRSLPLVTSNRREFDRVPGLIVTDWS